jgi:hypothetical protein
MAVSAAVTADQATSGQFGVWLDLETYDRSGSGGAAAAPKGWEAYDFAVTAEFGQADCVDRPGSCARW